MFPRIAAFFYDFLLCVGLVFLATYLALFINHGQAFGPDQAYLWLYLWCVLGAYFTFCWHKSGQTVGQVAWKLKVVEASGGLLTYKRACLRYLLATFSLLFFAFGFLFAFFNKRRLAWHDWVLGTQILKLMLA